MDAVLRVQKAVTMPLYKNDTHNDVEVSFSRNQYLNSLQLYSIDNSTIIFVA